MGTKGWRMKYQVKEYRSGGNLVPAAIVDEVYDSIHRVTLKIKRGAASDIREQVLINLARRGWPSEVTIDPGSGITITSMKNSVGLVFQTGNMSRIYADLLKLQTVYVTKSAAAAIFLSWSKNAAKELGQNLANIDRLLAELSIFSGTITIPMLVIGIEQDVEDTDGD